MHNSCNVTKIYAAADVTLYVEGVSVLDDVKTFLTQRSLIGEITEANASEFKVFLEEIRTVAGRNNYKNFTEEAVLGNAIREAQTTVTAKNSGLTAKGWGQVMDENTKAAGKAIPSPKVPEYTAQKSGIQNFVKPNATSKEAHEITMEIRKAQTGGKIPDKPVHGVTIAKEGPDYITATNGDVRMRCLKSGQTKGQNNKEVLNLERKHPDAKWDNYKKDFDYKNFHIDVQ